MSEKLAIHGGKKVRTRPWPAAAIIGAEEKRAVSALFDKAIATGNAPGYEGPEEEEYCRLFVEQMGGGYADGVNSGTNAVYVALRALNLPPFSEVLFGCITDPGGVMPIPLLNCIPIPVDTAPGAMAPGPEQVEAAITPRTSAILIAHIFGEPTDVAGIVKVAERHGLPVVEDCAQAHYAKLNGQMLGSFGKVSAFSTMFGKHHCTGGQGGIVFTKDAELYKIIRRAADRGKPFGLPAGALNQFAALNMNMDEFAACIGKVQLKKLPDIARRHREIQAQLSAGVRDLEGLFVPEPFPGAEPSYWRIRLGFRPNKVKCDRRTFHDALIAEGFDGLGADYAGALQANKEWLVNQRVFGTTRLPWSSPDYKGDPHRSYTCPNALKSIDTYFIVYINWSWTDRDVKEAIKICRKVENFYRA
jgi:dTDP-4-amino-4,6-dideoxygalactose transaminase